MRLRALSYEPGPVYEMRNDLEAPFYCWDLLAWARRRRPERWSVTQRLFPNVSELQGRVDGVNATSRHRDAVDVAVRESTRSRGRAAAVS